MMNVLAGVLHPELVKRTGSRFKSCEHTHGQHTFHSDIHSTPAHRSTHTHTRSISHQAPYLIVIQLPFLLTSLTGLRSYPPWESLTGAYMKEPFQHSSRTHTHTHTSLQEGVDLLKRPPAFLIDIFAESERVWSCPLWKNAALCCPLKAHV